MQVSRILRGIAIAVVFAAAVQIIAAAAAPSAVARTQDTSGDWFQCHDWRENEPYAGSWVNASSWNDWATKVEVEFRCKYFGYEVNSDGSKGADMYVGDYRLRHEYVCHKSKRYNADGTVVVQKFTCSSGWSAWEQRVWGDDRFEGSWRMAGRTVDLHLAKTSNPDKAMVGKSVHMDDGREFNDGAYFVRSN